MHNLLTVKETAKYLRIPLPTVYYLVQRGQLPAIQIGGRWRIKKSSLDKDILKEDKSGQPTVLVVDDDESLQNLFKLFLKKIGLVASSSDSQGSVGRLDKQKFDLIFLDLKLPDGPADDVYDTAKAEQPDVRSLLSLAIPTAKCLNRIWLRPDHGSEKTAQGRATERDSPDSRSQGRGQAGGLIQPRRSG